MISICVPVYNGAAFMDACFASIAAQTERDFEVLIVDDCSKDEGVAIARRWADADPRFRVYVNENNLGLVGNWNRCLELARGEWIKYLFQDDLMEAQCLELLLAASEQSCGFVACSRSLIFEGVAQPLLEAEYAKHRAVLTRVYRGVSAVTVALSPGEYADAMVAELCWNIVGEPSVTLIHRDLFARFGLFDPLLVQLCDSEMWNRICCNVGITYVPTELVSFRVHQGSASEANRGRRFRSSVLDEIIILKRLCSAPHYRSFRTHATSTGILGGLRRMLRHRVNAAFEEARAAAIGSPPDQSLRKDVREVLSQLPGYTAARIGHVIHRFRRITGMVK